MNNYLAINALSLIKLLAALQVMAGHFLEYLDLPYQQWFPMVITY